MKKITLKVASLIVFAALMTACFAGCTDTNKDGESTKAPETSASASDTVATEGTAANTTDATTTAA